MKAQAVPSSAMALESLLTLLAVMRRRNRKRRQEPKLPPGCVMVVRYSSR
jgi:hypothetical protein